MAKTHVHINSIHTNIDKPHKHMYGANTYMVHTHTQTHTQTQMACKHITHTHINKHTHIHTNTHTHTHTHRKGNPTPHNPHIHKWHTYTDLQPSHYLPCTQILHHHPLTTNNFIPTYHPRLQHQTVEEARVMLELAAPTQTVCRRSLHQKLVSCFSGSW